MGLNAIDMTDVLRRLAERRIEEAMREGKFDNLEGAGKPLDLEPLPANEDARMMWWTLRIMRRNDFLPHEVRWRKALDRLRESIHTLTDESRLPSLVAQFNDLVRKINTLGTSMMKSGVATLDLEEERLRFRSQPAGTPLP